MQSEPLRITLEGPLLDLVRKVANAKGVTVEEWVIGRLTEHIARLKEKSPPSDDGGRE